MSLKIGVKNVLTRLPIDGSIGYLLKRDAIPSWTGTLWNALEHSEACPTGISLIYLPALIEA